MKFRRVRALAAACAAVLALALFPACRAKKPEETPFDPNALTVLGKESDMQKEYLTRIFDLYKSETGKNLNLLSVPDSEFEVEASKRFKGEGIVPDILLHFHNADLNRFDEDDFFFLNDEAWADDLTDSAKNYCTDADGNLLGLPFWESSVSGCYYNKKIFDHYSLLPAATQSEFDNLCGFLNKVGITPVCWPASWPNESCTWMYQFALDPVFADGTEGPALLEALNSGKKDYADIPAVGDMVRWIEKAKNSGWFGNGDALFGTGWSDISPALAEGKAAMVFIWDTWFSTDFTPGTYAADDFALMPVFMGTAKDGTYEGGNLNMMMLNKDSEKLEEARGFLSFCAEPDHYNEAFRGVATVACFKGMTTNVTSPSVLAVQNQLRRLERVSTASTKIVGYSAEDVARAFDDLLHGRIDADECVARMDEARREEARKQGVAGF